jgi:hypothetical protein
MILDQAELSGRRNQFNLRVNSTRQARLETGAEHSAAEAVSRRLHADVRHRLGCKAQKVGASVSNLSCPAVALRCLSSVLALPR